MKQTLLILALFLQSFLAFAENITENHLWQTVC